MLNNSMRLRDEQKGYYNILHIKSGGKAAVLHVVLKRYLQLICSHYFEQGRGEFLQQSEK